MTFKVAVGASWHVGGCQVPALLETFSAVLRDLLGRVHDGWHERAEKSIQASASARPELLIHPIA